MRLAKIGVLLSQRSDLYVVTIEDGTPIGVAYDTPFASISKPATLNATLSDDSIIAVTPSWVIGTYTQDAPGDYDVYGNFDSSLPPGVTNPFLIEGHVLITVQEEIFIETFLAPTGFATWTVPAGVTELITAKAAGAGGSGGGLGQVGSASGAGGGAYAQSNTVAVTAGEIAVRYVAPQNIATLPTGSNVDGFDGAVSQLGPTAPAGSTILSGAGVPGGGTGSDGNYYFDTTNFNFYGPKTAGAWGSPVGTPWVRAAGGKKGIPSGAGGLGGVAADCIGDSFFNGGNGTTNAASRSGGGGGGASSGGAGGNAAIISGTNVQGGTGGAGAGTDPDGGNGGGGSTGAASAGVDYSGAGGGARNTVVDNKRGGTGQPGWAQVTYSGATVPPAAPGNVHFVAIWGQSNACSPGNGSPGAPYTSVMNTEMFSSSSGGFTPLEYSVNNNPGGSPTGLGPELSIASVIGAAAPNETFIAKKAQSGTSMYSNWNVANNSTGRSAVSQLLQALNYLEAQGKVIQTITVVMMQGEADMGTTNPNAPSNVEAEYKAKFADLIKYAIDHLESDGFDLDSAIQFRYIDVLLGDVYGGAVDTTYRDDVNAAKVDLMANFATDFPSYASKFAGGFTVNTDGLTRIDFIHYATASEITIGLDAAALISWIP